MGKKKQTLFFFFPHPQTRRLAHWEKRMGAGEGSARGGEEAGDREDEC